MIGAIAGDIIGSVYETRPIKTKDFPLFHPQCRFTEDSVLTIAVAKAIMEDRNYRKWIWEIGRQYMYAGYGGSFFRWLQSPIEKLPVFLRPLSYAIPLTYGADVLHGAVHGGNTMPLALDLSVLAIFCVGLFAASLWNIERKWIV